MGFKPAQQGSLSTLKPLLIKHWNQQHLPQGRRGEAVRPLAGGLGARPQGLLARKKLLLEKAFWMSVKRRLGAAEPQDRGSSPRAPARRGLTPLQPPQGRAGGCWMVS